MVDLSLVFARRAVVMKCVPRFLWGSFRIALKLALEEIAAGSVANDSLRQERGWKLFLVLPRMLLHRPPRGGLLWKEKMLDRFQKFAAVHWADLLRASTIVESRLLLFPDVGEEGRRQILISGSRVLSIWFNWESSSGRQALEGAHLAPGTTALNALRDPQKRTPRPREAIPEIPPHRPFELDEVSFCRNLRSGKKGTASGPSA